MASLYDVLPGLQPSQQDIVQAELLALQILQAQYPDLDLREGTGVRDLVLRPTAFILALLNLGLNYYFTQNTVSGVNDQTPQEVVDAILSNWFLERSLGTFAVISARLYFARQKNVSIASNVFFSPDNSLLFYPQQSLSIPASSMAYDSFSNEWFVDINLQAAQQGTAYNLSSGSLLYFSTFDPYFLRAEINFLVSSSTAGETNSQFIARAQTAISTRNLINNPSIVSNLEQKFNFIKQCIPIGYGDPEMVRDQIQAIFNPETPRLLTNLTSNGTTATATLPDHGWYNGQIVTITGALPSGYNGQYTITVVDTGTFTYTLSLAQAPVTSMPTVQSVTNPVLLHNGGMVDIYCDNQVATSIVQLTTDNFGNATLSGPIYAYSRSQVSGGSLADTIPFQANVNYSSATTDAAHNAIHVAATAHGLTTGTNVIISGWTQSLTISSISCSGLTVTATVTGHGLSSGTSVTVTGVTPTQYNGTFNITVVDSNTITYTVTANIPSSGSGSSMKLVNPQLNGTYPINVLGVNSFDIEITTLWANATTSGTLVISYDVPYTVENPNLQQQTIQSMTCSGTTVTVTLANHGQTANRYITISGASPSSYNGQWLISAVLNSNQFTFTVPTTIGSSASGTMVCTSVIPWYDVGFSSRQVLTFNFGSQYANSTASFQIDYFSNVADVQTYLEDAANRVLSADLLARGLNFYQLNFTVVGYSGQAPSSSLVQSVAQTYLTGLAPGAPFIMSDFMAALEGAGIISIQTPAEVTYTKYTRDLITPITGTITDYLDPNDRTNVFLLGTVSTSSVSI
jgi:hypothetical protein